MNAQPTAHLDAYNNAVQSAYFKILKHVKGQLAALKPDELRCTLIRTDEQIIHEFISPLAYLRLECLSYGLYAIHYGFEQVETQEYSKLTASFIRAVYYHTAVEQTKIDIEASVHTDWYITSPSELFEHIEERNKHHSFMRLKYKPQPAITKQRLAVA